MTHEARTYRCLNCNTLQTITTNHLGQCFDYCRECSWKPSFGQYSVPMFGRTYRPFEYVGPAA